jgi:hypothetical protein
VRLKLFLPVILVSLLAVPSGAEAAKRCKPPKVPVTVGKQTTCKALSKAFPKPRAIDPRLFYLQRGIKGAPLKAGGAKVARAEKKLLRALPKLLAHVDRRRGKRTASRSGATASAACSAASGGPASNIAGIRVSIGGENGAVFETESGGLTVKVRYGTCGRSGFGLPECPTASGDVESRSSSSGEVVYEIWEGTSRLVERARSQFESKAKAKGKVGIDAKLKQIELEYSHEVFIVASGGIVRRGKSERKVKILMPGGQYDAAGALAKVTGDADAVKEDGFGRVAKDAIDDFKAAEPRWSSFEHKPHCAEADFSPPSNSLNLHKGDSGVLSVSAKARAGGTASEARWTLSGMESATFSPGSSEAPAPSFSYTVTEAPQGGFVKVTVKFTSAAGVGEGTWTQPTEQSQLPVSYTGSVSGSAAYDGTEVGAGNSLQALWSGGIELDGGATGAPPNLPGIPSAIYTLSAGSISYSFSGRVGDCDVDGAGFIDLGEVPGMTGLPVLQLFDGSPRSYRLDLPMPLTEVVSGVKSNCEEESENGDSFDWPTGAGAPWIAHTPQPSGQVGDDWNLSGSGSGDNGPGSPDQIWQWSLTPSF